MVAIVPIALHLQERSGSGVIVAIGARWTLFLAGALPFVAGLVGLALHSRRRQVDEAPATVTSSPAVRDSPWDVAGCAAVVFALSQGLSLSGVVTSQRQSARDGDLHAHRR